METTRSGRRTGTARTWWALLGFGAAVAVAAAIGGLGVSGTSDEYASLRQPVWAPPSWLFGPVWTLLYATIAVAGWLVWRRVGFGPALWAWSVQLVLNAIWTPLFFGAGRYGLAFAEIVLMWLAIAATVVAFRRVSRPAAALLLPYWAWVTFAAALNLSIWQLNR
ncbi:TspO/MBR family protein [Micromonospora rifamycinica]|uniref:TspO and MBR related proteins n=1 Tax=Micromonospora rifamycinica TaxID=291594 RepID=A0A109INJ8_9ACTN|nr:TspO/MBR family protein [Micromonospora rifamycinica]KWV33821.1 peripheral-type benzodiazepine receptor [Micromonospora rifamycinica]SCG80148.1 TspO and MBR related proteins [Micromonospora rifamycinica]